MRRALAVLSVSVMGLVAACGGSPYGDFSNVPDRKTCEVNIRVSNMACEDACPIKVQSALANVDGVRRVDVDYASGFASVTAAYPACSSTGYEGMMRNLYYQGYKARIVSSRPLMGWEN